MQGAEEGALMQQHVLEKSLSLWAPGGLELVSKLEITLPSSCLQDFHRGARSRERGLPGLEGELCEQTNY